MGAPAHHSPEAEAEPQSPMWLPALGAALFIGAAIWFFGTSKPAEETTSPPPAQEKPKQAPEAKRAAAPADSGKFDAKQMEERIRAMQEQFKGRKQH